jgi:hypothetical protein
VIEIGTELNAIHRRVSAGPGDESVGVLLRRRYDAAGAPTSIVELRLHPEPDGATALELEHMVPRDLAGGAGALYVGPGWDGALLGLGLYLRGEVAEDPVAAANSREVQEFNRESIEAWRAEIGTAGTATDAEIAEAKDVALAQFAPDLRDVP